MITNQSIVLKALYWAGKEVSINEIVNDTGLKRTQVYMALYNLKQMHYIKKRTDPVKWNNGIMTNNKTFIKLSNPQITEKILRRKGVI